jgi:hypothetical protein
LVTRCTERTSQLGADVRRAAAADAYLRLHAALDPCL